MLSLKTKEFVKKSNFTVESMDANRIEHTLQMRPKPFAIRIDGEDFPAYPGETIATVLQAADYRAISKNDRGHTTGLYCCMGVCHSCQVFVNGTKQRACRTIAQPHLEVSTANAAICLARFGVDSVLVDENPKVVAANYEERSLDLLVAGRLQRQPFDALIVASGCYERSQPFPGWILPGVMSLGGIQIQLKSAFVKPGRKIILAGTGPLLLAVARQLHRAGATVAGVFESGRRRDLLRALPGLLFEPALLREGLRTISDLKRAGIPVHFGWGIVAAHGKDALAEVQVAPYDSAWKPIAARQRRIAVDCLGVGYGFLSRVQLTQMLGCEHLYDSFPGGLHPFTDRFQRSSRRAVYVAGDSNGVYGAQNAAEQGKLAALACLLDTNRIEPRNAKKLAVPLQKRIRRLQRFRMAFKRFSQIRPGLLELPAENTVVCRCEGVRRSALDRALQKGDISLTALKMTARIGMGDCQGKMCLPYCAEYLMQKTGQDARALGESRPRFPLSPVPFAALLQNGEEEHV